MAIFLDTKCRLCNYYRYVNSDFGRLGSDYYTCSKNKFASTREKGWYLKAQRCNSFETSFALTEKDLEQIRSFENQVID
jgi:hypothetical protein